MGENDLLNDGIQVSEVPDIPDPTRQVPVDLDITLVKNLYNGFCDRCDDAGLPTPPRWT